MSKESTEPERKEVEEFDRGKALDQLDALLHDRGSYVFREGGMDALIAFYSEVPALRKELLTAKDSEVAALHGRLMVENSRWVEDEIRRLQARIKEYLKEDSE